MEVGGQAVLVKLGVPGSADQRWRISVFMAFFNGQHDDKTCFFRQQYFQEQNIIWNDLLTIRWNTEYDQYDHLKSISSLKPSPRYNHLKL
jgi:hypothetical protein